MANFKDKIKLHIQLMDEQLKFQDITNKTLNQWFNPLLNSFTEDGAISYLLNIDKRFRASPLSSTLEWLTNSNLLPIDCIDILQNKLIFLRDNNETCDEEEGNSNKYAEDNLGWSLAEGVSIWSTSTALIALFDKYGNWKKHISVIKASSIWLAKQRKTNSAWAYQLNDNCTESIIMTSLALRALCKIAINESFFNLDLQEKNIISEALHNGYLYISSTIIKDKKNSYWNFLDKGNCAATTWALMALKELKTIKPSNGFTINTKDINEFFENNLDKCLNFILSKIPKKIQRWEDEQIVFEGGAKYNKQKNYQSLSVTLLPQLFELGLSPYQPKVINQIKWLINNPDEWKIKTYDRGNICSFSYAMVLATITTWISKVGNTNATLIMKPQNNIFARINNVIFGQLSNEHEPFQLVHKNRITILISVLVSYIALSVFGKTIWLNLKQLIVYLFSIFIDNVNDIVINIVASFCYAFIIYLFVLLGKMLKKLIR